MAKIYVTFCQFSSVFIVFIVLIEVFIFLTLRCTHIIYTNNPPTMWRWIHVTNGGDFIVQIHIGFVTNGFRARKMYSSMFFYSNPIQITTAM